MEGHEIVYDEDTDTLIIYWNKQPAVSVDYGGDFWLRVHPITKEPVGIEIGGFRRHFLEKFEVRG